MLAERGKNNKITQSWYGEYDAGKKSKRCITIHKFGPESVLWHKMWSFIKTRYEHVQLYNSVTKPVWQFLLYACALDYKSS